MILADSAVWIDHLRRPNGDFAALLDAEMIVGHPFVTGEIALGSLSERAKVIKRLNQLEQLPVALTDEVAALIEAEALFARGIGYVDAHLLASARLVPGTFLWTRDKRLHAVAEGLSIAAAGDGDSRP